MLEYQKSAGGPLPEAEPQTALAAGGAIAPK
jgi:hypothetical protein